MEELIREIENMEDINECEGVDEEWEEVNWDDYRDSYKDYISSYIY